MLPSRQDLDPETLALLEAALPRTAREIAALIGIEALLAFVEEFGGQEIIFPKCENGVAAEHFAHLVEIIGRDNVCKLQMHFGHGIRIGVPVCARAQQVLRNREIIKAYDELLKQMSQPKAVTALVRRYRLTSKMVENIVNGKSGLDSSRPSRAAESTV